MTFYSHGYSILINIEDALLSKIVFASNVSMHLFCFLPFKYVESLYALLFAFILCSIFHIPKSEKNCLTVFKSFNLKQEFQIQNIYHQFLYFHAFNIEYSWMSLP